MAHCMGSLFLTFGGGGFWTSCWAGRKGTTDNSGTIWSAACRAARKNLQRSISSSRPGKHITRRSGFGRMRNRHGYLEATAGRVSLTRITGRSHNGRSTAGTAAHRSQAITMPTIHDGLELEDLAVKAPLRIELNDSGCERQGPIGPATTQKRARCQDVHGVKLSRGRHSSIEYVACSPFPGSESSLSATIGKL